MKKLIPFIFIFVFAFIIGCHTYKDRPALVGGDVSQSKCIKGGSIGSDTKGMYSAVLDEQDRQIMEKNSPRTVDRMDSRMPLTISDIIKLSQNGVCDELIVDYIKQTNTLYRLSKSQVKRMQQNGVSQRIINYMLESNK